MLESLKLSIDQREAEMARDGAVDVDIPPTTPSHETMCDSAKERVNWAISLVREPLTVCEALLVDLRLSTEAVSGTSLPLVLPKFPLWETKIILTRSNL